MTVGKRLIKATETTLVLQLTEIVKDWTGDDIENIQRIWAKIVPMEDGKSDCSQLSDLEFEVAKLVNRLLAGPFEILDTFPPAERAKIWAQVCERRDEHQRNKKLTEIYRLQAE